MERLYRILSYLVLFIYIYKIIVEIVFIIDYYGVLRIGRESRSYLRFFLWEFYFI